jgi:hypothetical protein
LVSDLLTTDVWNELSHAAANAREPAHVAVAYFGSGASRLLPLLPSSVLVVDASAAVVKAGGTSPSDLLRMHRQGVRIHSFPNLHAKVYVFSDVAFVGSANVSRHSQTVLLEAVLRTRRQAHVAAARRFVQSLCVAELHADDLARLARIYRPPRISTGVQPTTASADTLIMELTLEQGRGRETQVQPPKSVWAAYFGLDSSKPPPPHVFSLTNVRQPGAAAERRPIVSHHHVWTLEMGDAAPPRPAILVLRRQTKTPYSYSYGVYRRPDPEFRSLQHLLATIKNPSQGPGRRWVLM